MEKIFNSVLEGVGRTPLVKVKYATGGVGIWAKLEMLNPSGSIKDRMAIFMVEKAEKKKVLRKGMTILEATTGNTGIALAMVAAVKGYKMVAVMPENMTWERQQMVKAFGGEVILTPAEDGPSGAIKKRDFLAQNQNLYWVPGQFENQDNTFSHEIFTGKEIIEQMDGKIDAFVAGGGTGGTLVGIAKALKVERLKTKIIAVEPAESAVLSGKKTGTHNIQGIGEGFIPKLVRKEMIDEVIKVSTQEAVLMVRKLARENGIFAGFSSGANMVAAIRIANKMGAGKRVVTIFPDRGERYLSEGVF